jgi:hypothetical protein
MDTIEEKIYKYQKGYVKGEIRSKEYESQIKQEKRLNMKIDLADTMFNELNFKFTQPQKQQVKTLIREFPNFQKLHNKATYEEIILSMIFYVKSLESYKTRLNQPLINKFTNNPNYPQIFEIIMWKITLHYIQKQPILPTEPRNIDHNTLYKG